MKKFFTSIALIVFSTAIVLAQPKGMLYWHSLKEWARATPKVKKYWML